MAIQDEIHSSKNEFLRSIKTPLLMLQGGQDVIGCNRSSRAIYQAIGSDDKNVIGYDDCGHHILADGHWVDNVANDTIGW